MRIRDGRPPILPRKTNNRLAEPMLRFEWFCCLFFIISPSSRWIVAGGNQRELARAKNQKKQQEIQKKKGANDKSSNAGLTLEQRKHRYGWYRFNFVFCISSFPVLQDQVQNICFPPSQIEVCPSKERAIKSFFYSCFAGMPNWWEKNRGGKKKLQLKMQTRINCHTVVHFKWFVVIF